MERKILHRFFEGTTSNNEEKQIRQWIKLSEDNYNHFLRERKMYDALLLTDIGSTKENKKKESLFLRVASIAAAIILLLVPGSLYLFHFSDKTERYNTIHVPAGQRINLILSDNTNLWLNANSTFRYPTEFSHESRTVYLDGEAFFKVSSNKEIPFIVKTAMGDIHVTGTIFNVEACSKHNILVTSLFEGGVDIVREEEVLVSLKPNQKGSISNEELLITSITNSDEYLWKDGLIAFNNQKLEDVLYTLEKYFAVEFQIKTGSLSRYTYTGKFRQSDGVEYALRVLQKSIHFSYERDEKNGIIYIR